MPTINFKPKQVTKKILSPLNDRSGDVIISRFGLNNDGEWKTLEAIGQDYGITRERVRQIESVALNNIRKSDIFKETEAECFKELKDLLNGYGTIMSEEDFLSLISKDRLIQNHVHFYLVLGNDFNKFKEDEHFKDRWSVDSDVSDSVHDSLKKLYENLADDEILPEAEMISRFFDNMKDVSEKYKNEEVAKRWLSMSKKISKNPLGEWGRSDSVNVKTRGIRDYAFLVMRKNGSPMHFKEVAKSIEQIFNRKAHVATCHNELIKDPRFVLVGRGMYVLSEWGYKDGIVKDVIEEVLKKSGPLSKEEVIEQVLKERYVQRNTIIVNLQNKNYFKKNKQGLYTLA